MPRQQSKCPSCGSPSVAPIVYGLPDANLQEQARRGEVVLGGCEIIGEDPNRACRECGHQWRRRDRVSDWE